MEKKRDKPNKENINTVIGCVVMIIALVCGEIALINDSFPEDIQQSEIITFKGEITNVLETQTSGRGNNEIIYFKLNNKDLTFKVSGFSYRNMDIDQVLLALRVGNTVEAGTTKEDFRKAKRNREKETFWENRITRKVKVQTMYLHNGNIQLFDLDEYNWLQRDRRESNLFWGSIITPLGILLFGALGYANWKTRFEH